MFVTYSKLIIKTIFYHPFQSVSKIDSKNNSFHKSWYVIENLFSSSVRIFIDISTMIKLE